MTAYEVDHSEDGVAFTNIKNGLRPNVWRMKKKNEHEFMLGRLMLFFLNEHFSRN